MIKEIYRKYYKKSILNKTLFTFSLITVLSLFILTEIILSSFGRILEEKELSLNSKILNRVESFFEQKYKTSQKIYQRMYLEENSDSLRPSSFFMEDTGGGETQSYLSDPHFLIDRFLTSSFQLDIDIHDVIVRKNSESTYYIDESSTPVLRELGTAPVDLVIPEGDGGSTAKGFTVLPAHTPSYLRSRATVFTMAANIVDTYSNEKKGEIFVEFNTNSVHSAYGEFQNDLKGYILALTKDGDVIFDSSGTHYGTRFPYMDQLSGDSTEAMLEEPCVVNTLSPAGTGVLIAGIIPKKDILSSINTIKRTFYLIALLFILASVLLAYLNTARISHRVKAITEAMKKLRKGDLSTRIHVGGEEDELSDIASNYNQMCSDLENYIKKVYLSEIRQKTAQLKALQSQINPHFLYNTLETIRMRAITRGDDDAGEMIHLLAVLFRSTIRDEMIIEVRNEIKYCNIYLALFKIRYEDRLTVEFDIEEGIEEYGILKHLLQPIIENYIVHGFDPGVESNRMKIKGYEENGDILFQVSDNGRGMEKDRLAGITASLKSNGGSGTSIGLANVNERIRLIYGENYGLDIASGPGKGTVVTIRIQAKSKEELKSYVQDTDR